MPFWFWNDRLDAREILRQIADFQAHGVHGFLIHPRVGLPRSIGWMSEAMLDFMAVAIEEAQRRGMIVILYDEGMYPSGSSSGQVVAADAGFACRGLACRAVASSEEAQATLPQGANLLAVTPSADGRLWAIIDQPSGSHIRGLHYRQDDPPRHAGPDRSESPGSPRPDPPEDGPPAADLLNPRATECFLRLVYQKYYDRFARHFGKTIRAIFTDEPSLLGRGGEKGLKPGTTDILCHVRRLLGYDFTPHLPALWLDSEPYAEHYRREYRRAVHLRMEETFYQPISRWCQEHGVVLAGHPAGSDEIGPLRHFHWPGQDLVWRYVVPDGPSALAGEHATMAKCSSSAAVHFRRERNANEFCGAYGRQLTFDEMKWLADWCLVRGVNLLIPHAFYYSIRGPRIDERPPDVGPNSSWWPRYKFFADYCRRLSWLNSGSQHICSVAVMGLSDHLPWQAAKTLQESQIDFNYLQAEHLWQDAIVDASGIRLAGMHYQALVIDDLPEIPAASQEALRRLRNAERVVETADPAALLEYVKRLAPPDLSIQPPASALRYRHVIKDGRHVYLLHNECREAVKGKLTLSVPGPYQLVNPWTMESTPPQPSAHVALAPHETVLVLPS